MAEEHDRAIVENPYRWGLPTLFRGPGHRLFHQSGLLALSGRSSDMHRLAQSAPSEATMTEAPCQMAAARRAALPASSPGGVDAIDFTGGIGGSSSAVRVGIAAHSNWHGFALDAAANAQNAPPVPNTSKPRWIVPADEERCNAAHGLALLEGN